MTATASLHGITYHYPNSARAALRDVTLEIGPGLTLVAGESGGGKSTLLRLLDGLVPQFHGGRISGSATVAGLDPLRDRVPLLARRVGLVFQDAETQSVYGTVEREIAFGLENVGMPRLQMHDHVDETLAMLAIEHLRTRRLSTLSGGERQRVQLAAVLALRPELIALDEPTSQLDRAGAAALLEACRSLADSGRTVVLAEHRLDDALPLADVLVTVADGAVAGAGDPRALAGGLASPPPLVELSLALGWQPVALTVDEAATRLATALRGERPAKPERTASARTSAGAGSQPAWQTRLLCAGHVGRPVVSEVSLAGFPGEVIAVVGANGSGKTTLLRTLAGLLPPLSGSIEVPAERVAYVPQNPAALLHLPTLRAELELTARRLGVTDSPDALLNVFGLTGLADRYPRDLSSGERQRGAIAATLAGRPRLALLDEPTRGMDLRARRSLAAVVADMAASGTCVVVATHDVDLAAEIADRVVLVDAGRVTDLGAPERAFGAEIDGRPNPLATQIARLLPGVGAVTVSGALAALAAVGTVAATPTLAARADVPAVPGAESTVGAPR